MQNKRNTKGWYRPNPRKETKRIAATDEEKWEGRKAVENEPEPKR